MKTAVIDSRVHRSTWSRIRDGVRRRMASFATRRIIHKAGARSFIAVPRHIWGGRFIEIGDNVSIFRDARFEAFPPEGGGSSIVIGDGTMIHPGIHIGAAERVEIGRKVLIAAGCYITDHDHDWSDPFDPPIENCRLNIARTTIGDYTWLGERVMVLKGVNIGERCIIGAGSLVTKDIPDLSVAIGSPARVVKTWDMKRGEWRSV